ncbi:MAG: PAS domain-containing protein [Desulfomicrobium sp.]|nr:PAS domain-containing protein [Pseudomonadota bacterium]MBV1711410.1 PAS domain-containing protein [Desulfomicrobium sp.]MBU4570812.1 PAS domain-containing protein [Pseudomonadota bacterium]MBU4595302.1 PAS domain-containing protein [Pseudomonadota bacterium]MBV1720734.1 PAS domain-containing protein [Desulfomicrobium sp.]
MNNKSKAKHSDSPATNPESALPAKEVPNPAFPIVGVGASAGGLEALEQFLRHVPEKSGLAFVVVQHLDPTHKALLPELLQRATAMPVQQVKDRMRVEPDCVYVIPPNHDMSILHGVLHLFKPAAPRGLRLPIDFFFRSLAEDMQERSIGIILSGMGSDGTQGLRAIKEMAGLALVQEPASAKFDSMPRNVINAGLADVVAPVEELPVKLLGLMRHARVVASFATPLEEKTQSGLEKIILLLRTKTGHDFSLYKKNTLYRRIERRMCIHQIDRIMSYVRFLQENSQETEILFKELLIGVTSFFRDPAAWEHLQENVLPLLVKACPPNGILRAWTPGCSTGEEAYSLAILFKETVARLALESNIKLRIFATDLDKDAIDKARYGLYPQSIAADVSAERLDRFFVQDGNGYRVGQDIRQVITFAKQNVIMDSPFTKLDILICRNLLIYLAPELQQRLLSLFHYSLNPNGALFLGSSESINFSSDLFAPIDNKSRLFRRRDSILTAAKVAFPPSFIPVLPGVSQETTMLKPAVNIQSLADQVLLQHFAPPAVLVNSKGDILYISGRTGKYLEPPAGKANWNIHAMAREGLRFDLGAAFLKALRHKEAITVKGLKITEGETVQTVDLSIKEIQEPDALRGMVMIIFTDVVTPPKLKATRRSKSGDIDNARIMELEQDLHLCREELRTAREDMQASEEELKSYNEEMQSTNEELQSTNEELTTSREEMQSLNEELQTVNAEQQSKMDELARINDDMRNLLNSTEIVTIFLDNDLHVRRFTPGANKIFKLIPGDVGRPLSDITSDLIYPEMPEQAQDVLRTLAFSEKQVCTADGRWYAVRIMPYRTMNDVIAGLVMTFTNITSAKKLERELREENDKLILQLSAGGSS